jgi:flagellar assembly factor FliW
MRIQTRTLGVVEATPDSFVTLPEGLLGYEDHREFALVTPAEYAPFRWLLSFRDPDVSFPVLDARLVAADYRPALAAADTRALGAPATDPYELLVLATLDPAEGRLTVNLRAPIILHPVSRLARQVVLSDGRWTVDHAIAGAPATEAAARPGTATRQAA